MKPIRRLVAIPFAVVLYGCTTAAPASSPGYARHVVTAGEISNSTATNAFDLIRRLRPRWLKPRGQVSLGRQVSVVVYVNGRPAGGTGILADISIESVRELRYLTGSEATQRFGTDHGEGAILVTLR